MSIVVIVASIISTCDSACKRVNFGSGFAPASVLIIVVFMYLGSVRYSCSLGAIPSS
jgi:hypothetical protein